MPLIIDRPALVPVSTRLGWGLVTVFFWAVWIYLWMPLVTLTAWSLGIYRAYSELSWQGEMMELRRLAGLYLIVAGALGGSLLLWAFCEYMRFRNKNRRTMPLTTQLQDLAVYTGLHVQQLASWQTRRCVIAEHDEHGALLSLADLSVEELANIRVTSVSKKSESLADAPIAA
jgi:biofilm PGA synthesis protein PgaD